MAIPVYTEYGGKSIIVGQLDSDKVFRKVVQTKQRLMCFDSYGLDLSYVEKLKALGCKVIELREKDTGKTYRIAFDFFLKKAIRRNIGHFPVRLYLPLKEWQDPSKPQPQKPVFPELPLNIVDFSRGGGETRKGSM